MLKPEDVPLVTTDHVGVSVAGRTDECLYCHQKVGSPHLWECVTVTEPTTYEVWLDERLVGTWVYNDPVSWDLHMKRFHKNDSSWCSNNMKSNGELSLHDGVELPFDPDDDSGICTMCGRVRLEPLESPCPNP